MCFGGGGGGGSAPPVLAAPRRAASFNTVGRAETLRQKQRQALAGSRGSSVTTGSGAGALSPAMGAGKTLLGQ